MVKSELYPKSSGIYSITIKSKQTKIYIGQAVNLYNRILHHQSLLRHNNHHNTFLQNLYGKYADEFIYSIIYECSSDELTKTEKRFINHYLGLGYTLYNVFLDPEHPGLGYKHTEEAKKKMSEQRRGKNSPWFGKKHTEETKRKMSEAQTGENHSMYGKCHSDESKKKISEAGRGRVDSEETKQKRKESFNKTKKTGEDHHWHNKKHTEETKRKMSERAKGRVVSEETKQRLRDAWNIRRTKNKFHETVDPEPIT